jgi:ABC-2 type transport system permease protein
MKKLLMMTGYQFRILLRNRGLLVGSLGLAVVSMLIFGFLFSNNTTSALAIGVADQDHSAASAQILTAMQHDQAMTVTIGTQSTLVNDMKNGHYSAVVVLPSGFGNGLTHANAQAQVYIDQSDLIAAARSQGIVYGVFDAISKQVAGFKDLIHVQQQQVTVHQLTEIDILTPGMLGLTIMFANMSVGVALIYWRRRGTLQRLNATPLKAWQLIGSQILSQFALSFAQAAIILAIAVTVFHMHLDAMELLPIAVMVIVGTFSIISLGYAIGNFVKKQEAAQAVVLLISLPMMFLGGSYFLVDPPGFLKIVANILPLTYLNHALRQVMMNGNGLPDLLPDIGFLLLIGVVLLTISVNTFRWGKE